MVDPAAEAAETVFRDALARLGADYGSRVFYVERDIVFTLQTRMVEGVRSEQLPVRVYNDYPMIAGPRRSLSADLALVATPGDQALLAAEFKYEPCHRRLDLLKEAFQLVRSRAALGNRTPDLRITRTPSRVDSGPD